MTKRHATWAGLAMATLLAAGCAGGGDDGVATLTGSADAAEQEASGTTLPPDEAMLQFVRCMREHGIDMPDPDPDGGMVVRRNGAGERTDGIDPESEEFQEAEEACADLRPQMTGPSEEELADMQDQLLAMARCMRRKGFDVPDPEVSRSPGGGVRATQRVDGNVDPEDPEFRAAQSACSEETGLPDPDEGPGRAPR